MIKKFGDTSMLTTIYLLLPLFLSFFLFFFSFLFFSFLLSPSSSFQVHLHSWRDQQSHLTNSVHNSKMSVHSVDFQMPTGGNSFITLSNVGDI